MSKEFCRQLSYNYCPKLNFHSDFEIPMEKLEDSTETSRLSCFKQYCFINNKLYRNLLCEFVCTTFLMYTGLSINAQTVLSRFQMNNSIGISLGWGTCLTFAVYMGYNISGSHMNPAFSFLNWSYGQLTFLHFVFYSIVQTIGAFFGALLTFFLYYEKIQEFDGGNRQIHGPNATAGIFATYPGDHLSVIGCLFDQICATTVLCIIVGIITDERNHIPKCAQPPLFGVMIAAIGLGFGLNAGNAMNPARDLGPRVFTYLFVGPLVGAIFGSWLYQLIIGSQIPEEAEEFRKHNNKSISYNGSYVDFPIDNRIKNKILVAENNSWSRLSTINNNTNIYP